MPSTVLFNTASQINKSLSGVSQLFGDTSVGYSGSLFIAGNGFNSISLSKQALISTESGVIYTDYGRFIAGPGIGGFNSIDKNLSMWISGRSEFQTGVGVTGNLEVIGASYLTGNVDINGNLNVEGDSDIANITSSQLTINSLQITKSSPVSKTRTLQISGVNDGLILGTLGGGGLNTLTFNQAGSVAFTNNLVVDGSVSNMSISCNDFMVTGGFQIETGNYNGASAIAGRIGVSGNKLIVATGNGMWGSVDLNYFTV